MVYYTGFQYKDSVDIGTLCTKIDWSKEREHVDVSVGTVPHGSYG